MVFLILFIAIVICVALDQEVLGNIFAVAFNIYLFYRIIRWLTRLCSKKSPQVSPPSQEEQSHREPAIDYTPRDDYWDGTFFCEIAGVQYHCGNRDVGGFFGFVEPELDNEYDPRALAVRDCNGRLLGYIPRTEQENFHDWTSKSSPLRCAGFIKIGTSGKIYGRVNVFDGDENHVLIAQLKFIKWMIENLGLDFLPAKISYNGTRPKDAAGWCACIDADIATLENAIKDGEAGAVEAPASESPQPSAPEPPMQEPC